jgi:predicted enzyme related to lactoylglutathione lyase
MPAMKGKYRHTNIVARDRQSLARFYETVFRCTRVPPERYLFGSRLSAGTGVVDARFSGVHLRMPGTGADGPTLEIYRYASNESKPSTLVNREGICHLPLEVDDVGGALTEVCDRRGNPIGEVVSSGVEGVGLLTFGYASDPKGNIIELQSWR